MTERGVGVHIASGGGARAADFSALGVHLLNLNIRTKSELDPRIYCVLPLLKRYIHRQEIDIIHAQTRITQVMGLCLSKMTKRPFVSTCHGFFKPRLSRKDVPLLGGRGGRHQ